MSKLNLRMEQTRLPINVQVDLMAFMKFRSSYFAADKKVLYH